jgi:hypothetical protein
MGAIRFSLGRGTTDEEIDVIVAQIHRTVGTKAADMANAPARDFHRSSLARVVAAPMLKLLLQGEAYNERSITPWNRD